jgi:hypothetical protein
MPTAAELRAMLKVVKPVKESKLKDPTIKKTRAPRVKTSEKDPRQMDLAGDIESLIKIPAKAPVRHSRKDYGGNGHWSFEDSMGTRNKVFGFIYIIRDLRNNRSYIGKKQYYGRGVENYGEPSNWPWYISSRDSLVEQIQVHGKENFEFIVLEEYFSDKGLGYAETWSLMFAETPSNQDKWYNRVVNKINWFSKEAISERHKRRLLAVMNNEPLDTVKVDNV